MTTLAMVDGWDDWTIRKTGDGAQTPNADNTLITLSAGAGSTSYLLKRIPANPGETITVSVVASNISGNPQIAIDYPTTGAAVTLVTIDKKDLSKYQVQFTVPYTADYSTDTVQIAIGVYTSESGGAVITSPSISVENSPQGFVRSYCLGLVQLTRTAGVVSASINSNFTRTGIKAVSYNPGSKRLTVSIQKSSSSAQLRPIFDAGMTMDLLPDVTAKAGQYSPTTGDFKVMFNDGSADFIDITTKLTDGQIAYCWVRAGGI